MIRSALHRIAQRLMPGTAAGGEIRGPSTPDDSVAIRLGPGYVSYDHGETWMIAKHWTDYAREGYDDPQDWLYCDCGGRYSTPRLWAEHVRDELAAERLRREE